MYRVGQKIRTVLRVDNFATVNGRKVCDMLIVFEFCLERKKKNLDGSKIKHSLPS